MIKFSNKECEGFIIQSEQKNDWLRNTKLKKYSYYTTSLVLNEEQEIKIKKYCKDYLNLDVENVSLGILKYIPNDFFARHKDKVEGLEFNHDFLYNINMRLNDNYDGGDFYLDDKLYNKSIGEIYHYSSDVYHEVTEVLDGIRYSALFYIRQRDLKRKTTLL